MYIGQINEPAHGGDNQSPLVVNLLLGVFSGDGSGDGPANSSIETEPVSNYRFAFGRLDRLSPANCVWLWRFRRKRG